MLRDPASFLLPFSVVLRRMKVRNRKVPLLCFHKENRGTKKDSEQVGMTIPTFILRSATENGATENGSLPTGQAGGNDEETTSIFGIPYYHCPPQRIRLRLDKVNI